VDDEREAAQARLSNPAGRSAFVQGTITTALIALAPAGLVFVLFRNAGRKA
jgi:hypothetical protein